MNQLMGFVFVDLAWKWDVAIRWSAGIAKTLNIDKTRASCVEPPTNKLRPLLSADDNRPEEGNNSAIFGGANFQKRRAIWLPTYARESAYNSSILVQDRISGLSDW